MVQNYCRIMAIMRCKYGIFGGCLRHPACIHLQNGTHIYTYS